MKSPVTQIQYFPTANLPRRERRTDHLAVLEILCSFFIIVTANKQKKWGLQGLYPYNDLLHPSARVHGASLYRPVDKCRHSSAWLLRWPGYGVLFMVFPDKVVKTVRLFRDKIGEMLTELILAKSGDGSAAG